MQRKIQVLPTVEAWRGGECLAAVKGGEPAKVMEMLDKYFDESKDSSDGESLSMQFLGEAVITAGVVCALRKHSSP